MDLDSLRERSLSMADLVDAVGALCAGFSAPSRDERVRALPDERTLRYYQTLGVLDRPDRYEGRAAVYGFRHVLQAVAAKALQGAGYSLAQVQSALTGASISTLEAAVREAVTAHPGPPLRPAATPEPAPLRAYTLIPGVTLTVDARSVGDADALARALAAASLPFLTPPGANR